MQRVLIVEDGCLLSAGIQSLLSLERNLDVVSVSPRCQAELIQGIKRVQPDVVVLDELTHLVTPASLLALVNTAPHLRVVVVSANDNRVRIYGKQQALITRAADLVNIIHSD